MPTPSSLLPWLLQQEPVMLRELSAWVACETPTTEPARVAAHARDVAAAFAPLGARVVEHDSAVQLELPGSDPSLAPVLVLGHLDTVYAVGTLARMPVRNDGERLWGPGVYDMKGGIVQLLFALRALAASGTEPRRPLRILLTFDEETGSRASRPVIETITAGCSAALVLEPAAEEDGKLKIARKGIAVYRITAEGVAAHAGVDFAQGASAVVELARQVAEIAAWSEASEASEADEAAGSGLTVNPGVFSGGTRINIVAAHAEVDLEVRAWSRADLDRFDQRLRALTPCHPRVRVEISGGLNRPPMEPTPASLALASQAIALGQEMGLQLTSTGTGGGSDGNFTAALGVPTLDGLGAVGAGAHTYHEHVVIAALAPRACLLARLLETI
ncbi:MAG: M20 family metallopeptidase [Terriglobales bacterium]